MRGRNRRNPNPLTRSLESNGGDVKIRGTAVHIAEKYVQLARDAQASGDRVGSENYLQHAEHYFRIVAAAQAQQQQQAAARADAAASDTASETRVNGGGQPVQSSGQPTVGPNDPQPFAGPNGGGETGDGAPVGAASTDGGNRADGGDEGANRRPQRNARGPRRRPPYRDRSDKGETAMADQPQPQPPSDEQ